MRIEPPPILLTKEHKEVEHSSHILKVKTRRNLASATLETYRFKMAVFKKVQPEELLGFLKNFKKAIDGTGTTTVAGWINHLHTMLRGGKLQEFDELASNNNGTTNTHLKQIQEDLLGYFFPINALSKQNRAIHRGMSKPRALPMKIFAARLTELNNYFPLFPGSDNSRKM